MVVKAVVSILVSVSHSCALDFYFYSFHFSFLIFYFRFSLLDSAVSRPNSDSRLIDGDVSVEKISVQKQSQLYSKLSSWISSSLWGNRGSVRVDRGSVDVNSDIHSADMKSECKDKFERDSSSNNSSTHSCFKSRFKASNIFTPESPPPSDVLTDVRYKAIGVEYEQNGVLKRVYLKSSLLHIDNTGFGKLGVRSVVLTAGAIMTPKLLMNSGIGPKDRLEEAGIKVLVPSELVGRNLHDHPAVGVTFKQNMKDGGGKIQTQFYL